MLLDPEPSSKLNTKASLQLAKELFEQVPRYDGRGGLPPLNEFIFKFNAFHKIAVDLFPQSVIVLKASSKLKAGALTLYQAKEDLLSTWPQLLNELKQRFQPRDHLEAIQQRVLQFSF